MNKENWVELFRTIGVSDESMIRWHEAFESKYPAAHQSFLEWLNVPEDEIKSIRFQS